MALINCVECGKEISDQARACPNCGNPSEEQAKMQRVQDTNDDSKRIGYVILGVIIVIVGFAIALK